MTAFSFLSSEQHVVLDHQRLGPARLTAGFPVWYIKIKSKNQAGEVSEHTFHGHHPAYDAYVAKLLKEKYEMVGGNIPNYFNGVIDDLIPFLRDKITHAENLIKSDPAWSGKNLNDYFKAIDK